MRPGFTRGYGRRSPKRCRAAIESWRSTRAVTATATSRRPATSGGRSSTTSSASSRRCGSAAFWAWVIHSAPRLPRARPPRARTSSPRSGCSTRSCFHASTVSCRSTTIRWRRRREIWDSYEQAFQSYRGRGVFAKWRDDVLRLYVHQGFSPVEGGVRLKCLAAIEAQVFSMALRRQRYARDGFPGVEAQGHTEHL